MSFHGLQACWNLLTQGHGLLACTAELRQMRELDDGSINCLAVGDIPVGAEITLQQLSAATSTCRK